MAHIPPRIHNVTVTAPDGEPHHVEPITVVDEETGLSRMEIQVKGFLLADDTLTVTWTEEVGEECPHQGPRRLYADGPDHTVHAWRCLECGERFQGRP